MAEPRAVPSAEIAKADWIADSLSPFHSGVVTSVVPGGFEAYVRVLHPLTEPLRGSQPARWADVAAWSGVQLTPGIDFPEIAMPEYEPPGAEPWPGAVPEVGTLRPSDADALAAVLTLHTGTPDRCWFCLWDGWGSIVLGDGPRVELPGRRYGLFMGSLAALPSLIDAHENHSPNLWWPDDEAWCVATDIDLAWTYVGGPPTLVKDVLAHPGVEAQAASPDDSHHQQAPGWLAPAIEHAATELLESGTATLQTWRGTVEAQLERPDGQADGDLRIRRTPAVGFGGRSWSRITEQRASHLREILISALTRAVIELL